MPVMRSSSASCLVWLRLSSLRRPSVRVCKAPSVPSTLSAYLRKRFITPVSAVVLLSPPLSSSLTWVGFSSAASSLEDFSSSLPEALIETPMSDRRLRSPLPEPEKASNTIWRIWLWIPTAVRSACSLPALLVASSYLVSLLIVSDRLLKAEMKSLSLVLSSEWSEATVSSTGEPLVLPSLIDSPSIALSIVLEAELIDRPLISTCALPATWLRDIGEVVVAL